MKGFQASQLRPAIADFYTLALGIPPEIKPTPDLIEYRYSLISAWKATIIRDLEFCVACELRHVGDGTASPRKAKDWKEWFNNHFGSVGALWHTKWRAMCKGGLPAAPNLAGEEGEDFAAVWDANKSNSKSRLKSYLGSKVAEQQHGLSLIEVAEKAFNPALAQWSSSYGGKKWQAIAGVLLGLWHSSDFGEIVRLIDMAFALQHNTSIAFNKNNLWAIHGSFGWINTYLDYKWGAVSALSLLGLASKETRDLIQSAGFRFPQVPLANIAQADEVKKGRKAVLREGGSDVQVRVSDVQAQDGFYTIICTSQAYEAQKPYAEKSKTLKVRVFSLNEFLSALKEWSSHASPGAPVPIKKPKAPKPPAYGTFQALETVYKMLAEWLSQDHPGYHFGNLLHDSNHNKARFRLKGGEPLRFYLELSPTEMGLKVGHTEEADEDEAKAHMTFPMKESGGDLETQPGPEVYKVHETIKGIIQDHLK